MPKHGPGKRGGDGLTDRQRAFVRERRADPIASMPEIMRRAGFKGTPVMLGQRANKLMHDPKVAAAVWAPNPRSDQEIEDQEGLKRELKRFWLAMIRSNASASEKLKAARDLGATLQGLFVPTQIDMKGHMTMEALVHAMGGAPDKVVDQYSSDLGVSNSLLPKGEDA